MIVSSNYTVGHEQVDGRHYVNEVHTDSQGKQYTFEYLAAINTDYQAILTARAAQLETELAEQEANGLID